MSKDLLEDEEVVVEMEREDLLCDFEGFCTEYCELFFFSFKGSTCGEMTSLPFSLESLMSGSLCLVVVG